MFLRRTAVFPLFLLVAVSLAAQTATLTGRVLDQSGAVIPAAKVEVRSAESRALRTATSDANGAWSVAGLAAGRYRVTASAAQLFLPQPVEIELRAGSQSLDLQLQVAAAAQQVTIDDSAGPAVSTDASANASATVIKGDDLDALSDDPEDLQADLTALAGPSAGPGTNEILIDGFSTGDLPPKASIREVRVNQNPFSPDYDKLGLGRVEVFTKPGTDKYHGVLPYNLGTDKWNSRNPYAAQKAPFLLQEFESSFSGPLMRRSSFTVDLEKQNVDNGSISNGVVLDPTTSQPVPFSSVYKTLQRRFRIVPHIDYQISESNYLSLRYNYTENSIKGSGIGAFDLISRGYDQKNRFDTVQAIETSVHGSTVNETRFQYYRWWYSQTPDQGGPEIQVLGAFNGGGSNDPGGHQLQGSYELQNNTYLVKGNHSLRFGTRLRGQRIDSFYQSNFSGTFTYSSIDQYRDTVLGLPGGGPALFSINAGQPDLQVAQFEPSLYIGDDWRARPNVTVSLGLRYEAQTNIHDRADFAPRLGIAWSPGSQPGSQANTAGKTVLRAGFGVFYDRFALTNTLNAERDNGINQQQYVVENPDFTTVPAIASLSATQVARTEVDKALHAPYTLQTALSVERQLLPGTTLAATWTNAHALHVLRSEYILTPGEGPVFLMSSSGLYNQNQLIFNLNSRVNKAVSIFSSYVVNHALSNTDGISTFPGDPYNYSGEYGPAATDIRQRFQFGGTVNMPWNVRLSPLFSYQTGTPFNITSGTDPYGTTLYFARPGLDGSFVTPYGDLDPNPAPGEATIGRNAGRGPSQIMANIRINKMWPIWGGRSTFNVGLSIRNLLNHTNAGPIIGNIMSPLFGFANQMAGQNSGQGFSEAANNRRLELQIRLTY